MTRIGPMAAALSAVLFLAFAAASFGGEATPPLSELRKPVEQVQEENEDEPILPAAVLSANRVADNARLCPPDAVWYLGASDSVRLGGDWNASPLGALMREPAMEQTFRNNRFGLKFLFADLPESVITPDRIDAIAATMELSRAMADMSERMSMACYLGPGGEFNFLFLFDVGLDRIPAFQKMAEWETSFFLANPGSEVQRGDHAGNFLDVWRVGKRAGPGARAEMAAGFAENLAVVSNDPGLASACLALLSGGDNLADSSWGKRLAASIPASASADLVGFVRMDALLRGLEGTPIARDSVAAWADFLGYGDKGEAIYYGLQFTPEGARETYLLPASGKAEGASLVEVLARRLKPAGNWSAPAVVPYQPNPVFHFAAMLDGRQLGGLLRQERRLFGLSDKADAFTLPPAARRLFTNEMSTLFTGEIGLTFFPGAETAGSWLMVLPCSRNPSTLLGKSESTAERNGATIHSAETDWRKAVCWTAAHPGVFRRLNGNFLLIASDGDIMVATLDQLLAGASFASNKDFVQTLSRAEADQGMFFYINMPEILVRQYPGLSHIMRSLYPRSSGLNSRPPLALLRRYARGALAAIAPAAGESEFTRVTVQSPLPSLGALSAGTVLRFPMSLRSSGRAAMETSRDNLKNLWLRLQFYSSRFGHFPDTLDDLVAEMRVGMSDDEIRSLLTAPAALSRLSPEEAAARSYRYLSGVTPNDEPDVPILYEAEPWSEDFAGMYPTQVDRAPAETGDFQPYRQMILLDGKVVVMPERRFREKILPRLSERE